MKVVAEGIEEWGQATLLAEMGCDMGQGFYFSRPLLAEAVPGFIAG
jgi:EAL domain-containing protein (putative c-di-GMP-specific phosphodiesterase class I)